MARSKTLRPRDRQWQVAVVVVAAVVLGAYAWWRIAGHAATTVCSQVSGPFTVSGATVLQGNGKPFVSYGVTSPGLAHSDYAGRVADDEAQIEAAASSWCSNTVRLQISQDNLVGADGKTFSQPFMDAITTEVDLAKSLGLVAVINAQTEDVGLEPGPTFATEAFWRTIIGKYGNDPKVVFDIFNEPRVSTGSTNGNWATWQNGGTVGGTAYLGMQQVVSDIRAHGAGNLIWLEGPGTSTNLNLALNYPVTGGAIEYAIHHPAGSHNASTWDSDFGFLVNQNKLPVTDGEWSNYASTKGECWTDAPTAVPAFLSYLAAKHIGLNVWTLQQGVMIESANKADPTVMKSDWSCSDGLNEGSGRLVMDFFAAQNGVVLTSEPASGGSGSAGGTGAGGAAGVNGGTAAKPAAGASVSQGSQSPSASLSADSRTAGDLPGGSPKSAKSALAAIGIGGKSSTKAKVAAGLVLVIGLAAIAGWWFMQKRSAR